MKLWLYQMTGNPKERDKFFTNFIQGDVTLLEACIS